MKILGGNFGVNGSALISRDKKLVIEGASKGIYGADQVLSVSANVSKEKKFGILGFLVAAFFKLVVTIDRFKRPVFLRF
jgi:hypothetical protein